MHLVVEMSIEPGHFEARTYRPLVQRMWTRHQ